MTLQINSIDLNRCYTADEFEALPDDGNRYQLINGRLQKVPPAGDRHGSILGRLFKALLLFDIEEKLGKTWVTTGFKLDNANTPEPDLMFVVASRRPAEGDKALQIIPDLVVEIWSPSQLTKQGPNDESKAKIKAYQAIEVKLIWAINPKNRTVAVYQPNQPEPIAELTVNDELDGANIIPGFRLPVSQLFD